jgi:hypothetical protein
MCVCVCVCECLCVSLGATEMDAFLHCQRKAVLDALHPVGSLLCQPATCSR